jgi:hypothetical protein
VSEKELRDALLRLDALDLAGSPDPRRQVWGVLEGDRRRVRRLTVLTVCCWLLAGALVLGGLVSYGFTFPRQAKLMTEMASGKLEPQEREVAQTFILMSFQKGTLLIAFSVALMAAAALCTVFLIHASRGATLRQINSSLIEIGEQLKRLRPT